MIEDVNPDALELDEREYVCPTCRLVHWQGAERACPGPEGI